MSNEVKAEAIKLFPVRIKSRVVPAFEMPGGSGGAWDPKNDKAYIPIADNAVARTIRLHEATHAIFTKGVSRPDIVDQAIEDVRVHSIWLDDIKGLPARDEQVLALRQLRINVRGWANAIIEQGKISPEIRAVYSVMLTRSVAILQKSPKKPTSENLINLACANLGEDVRELVEKCIEAVKAGDTAKARKLFSTYAFLPLKEKHKAKKKAKKEKKEKKIIIVSAGEVGGSAPSIPVVMPEDVEKSEPEPEPDVVVWQPVPKLESEPQDEEPQDEGAGVQKVTEGDKESGETRKSEAPKPTEEGSREITSTEGTEKDNPTKSKEEETVAPEPEPEEEEEEILTEEEITEELTKISERTTEEVETELSPINKAAEEEVTEELSRKDPEDITVVVVLPERTLRKSETSEIRRSPLDAYRPEKGNPSPMYVHNLNLEVPRKVSGAGGVDYKPTVSGMRVRQSRLVAASMDSNVRLFERRAVGGAVLIDASGSMGLSDAKLLHTAQQIPLSTVAYYSANYDTDIPGRSEGHLVIYAKGGKIRSSREHLPFRGGANLVDLHALEWLLKQPYPRYFVTDCDFTGVCAKAALILTKRSLNNNKIVLTTTLEELWSVIKGGPKKDYSVLLKRRMFSY